MIAIIIIIGALALPVSIYLLRHPLLALNFALILLLLPLGLRVEPFYAMAANGMIVSALVGWLARPGHRTHWTSTCILLALLIGWAALTTIWAADATSSRRELINWLLSFTLLFLLVNQVDTLRAMDRLMTTMGAFGWMIVLASFHTILFTNYDFVHRLRVLDMNENSLGIMLLLMLPGILWPVLRSFGRRRLVLMVASVMYILCTLPIVALSGSRGSAVSLVLILFAFLLARSTRPWGFVGLALVSVALMAVPSLFSIILHRFTEENGDEMGGRGELWEASLRFIHDHPFTGAGVGNGPVALHDYIAAVTGAFNHRLDLPSHQPILEVGVDVGIVGIALYVAAILAALVSFARSRRPWVGITGAPEGYHMIVACTAAGFMSSWFKAGGVRNSPIFFLLLALLLLPAHLVRAHMPTMRGLARAPSVGHRRGSGRPMVAAPSSTAIAETIPC